MITKCIKLAIEFNKNSNIDEKRFIKELENIQHKTWLACNRALTYLYTNDMQNSIQKYIGIPKQDDIELFGKKFKYWIEDRMKEIMEGTLSGNVSQTRQFVCNRYKQDKSSGLMKGKVSLSQFKKDIPVIIHNKSYKIIETDKGLGIEIGFFNREKQKELNVKRIKFLFPRLGGSEKAIIKKLLDKSYKKGTIQINYNKRKKKWMCTIPYSFKKEINEGLNDNLIMGIDLGITNIATISIYNLEKKEYVRMSWKDKVIPGAELIHYRQKIEARRKELSIASKWCSDNRKGHGYKSRMIDVNKVGDKYKRFKDTYNHKISRYIIDLALKYKVKTIQMEDLSGFSEYQKESLLKNWSYYDLQNKIQYKANELDIDINFINPKYTSKRCSLCGNIHKDNRDCKNNQADFTCMICGNHENADINASKNIAIPNIDKIIEEYIKIQKEIS